MRASAEVLQSIHARKQLTTTRVRTHSRVLIVDDEPHLISGLENVLRDRPYEIFGATSATAALELLRDQPMDVVMADERMPGMTGSQLLCIVAREYPAAGRIILTGQATVEAAVRAINEARVVRFLLKPCRPEALCEAIEAALELRLMEHRVDIRKASHPSSSQPRDQTGSEVSAPREGSCIAPFNGINPGTNDHRGGIAAATTGNIVSEQDILLYAYKTVRLARPTVPWGYDISSWVRAPGGAVLTFREFSSVGDRHQLMNILDRQAVRRSLQILRRHAEALRRCRMTVSVNVSGHSIGDGDFADFLYGEIAQSSVGPSVLLQIDDSLLPAIVDKAADLLREICRTGCRIGISTACGSVLDRCERIGVPVARIKLDRTLVCNLSTDQYARLAILSVLERARRANAETVAPLVMTTSIANELLALGVDCGQGYAFGASQPLEAALGTLA